MEWIKTGDSLPEDRIPVLISVNGRRTTIAKLDWEYPTHEDNYEAFRYWCDIEDSCLEWFDVTHWMPLPDGPGQEP